MGSEVEVDGESCGESFSFGRILGCLDRYCCVIFREKVAVVLIGRCRRGGQRVLIIESEVGEISLSFGTRIGE